MPTADVSFSPNSVWKPVKNARYLPQVRTSHLKNGWWKWKCNWKSTEKGTSHDEPLWKVLLEDWKVNQCYLTDFSSNSIKYRKTQRKWQEARKKHRLEFQKNRWKNWSFTGIDDEKYKHVLYHNQLKVRRIIGEHKWSQIRHRKHLWWYKEIT